MQTATIPAGNFVVIGIQAYSSGGTTGTSVTCSDNAGGNTWTTAGQLRSGSYYVVQCWTYVQTPLTISNSFSVVFSGESGTCANIINAVEFSGVTGTSPVDQSGTGTGTGTTATATTAATTQVDELLFGSHGWGVNNTAVAGTGTGWTWYETNRTSLTGLTGYRIVAATGTYSSTSTYTSSIAWRANIVTYKGVPPAPTPTPTPSGPTATPTVTPTPTPTIPPLPLDKTMGQVRCMSCHDMHYTSDMKGNLLRASNINQLCTSCHTLADLTNGAHFSATTGVLWPGGQYGSTFPAITDATQRGLCTNCHRVHGWPDTECCSDGTGTSCKDPVVGCSTNADCAAVTGFTTCANRGHFPNLVADREENLCFTCHDSNGPATKQVQADFAKTRHHPVKDSEQQGVCCSSAAGTSCASPIVYCWTNTDCTVSPNLTCANKGMARPVECPDCHNIHETQSGAHAYSATATSTRNQVSGPILNVIGVAPVYPAPTPNAANNFLAPSGYTSLSNAGRCCSDVTGTSCATPFVTCSTNANCTVSPNLTCTVGATLEYQICVKCHSNNFWGTSTVPEGLSPNGTAVNPVETNVAQEFNPNNMSGHPIVTGLDNYPNSTAVGTPLKKGLQAGLLIAPWNINIGTQTMMCSDCHNTDAASPAAQGPHGSAVQFMLRGTNAANWPNVTLTNRGTSWCANCHPLGTTTNNVHTDGNHSGRYCYECHIVVPHGGRVSRLLLGDINSTVPLRYYYNNTRPTNRLNRVIKRAYTAYAQADCNGCSQHTATTGEAW